MEVAITKLVNELFKSREITFFIGAGASQDGKIGEQPFPGYAELKSLIIHDVLGCNIGEKIKEKWECYESTMNEKIKEDLKNEIQSLEEERDNKFNEIVKKWGTDEGHSYQLRKYLSGEPGNAHYLLAAIAVCLFTTSSEHRANILLNITTNYDSLIEIAYDRILNSQKAVSISLCKEYDNKHLEKIKNNIKYHLKNGTPVVLKLFGDLDFVKPIFDSKNMTVVGKFEEHLKNWLNQPMVFIGFSFSDDSINWVIEQTENTTPIFVVNPSIDFKKIPNNRNIIPIKYKFDEFTKHFLSAIDNHIEGFKKSVRKEIGKLNPINRFQDYDSILELAQEISLPSKMRAEAKLTISGTQKNTLVPINRENSRPDIDRFLKGDKPLLALIGESGTGKSTMLHQILKVNDVNHLGDFSVFFLEAKSIPPSSNLQTFLSTQFYCSQHQFRDVLKCFQKILDEQNRHVLIIIDGINESPYKPSLLKDEIENLGAFLQENTPRVKILYSCRTIYWRNYIYTSSSWLSNLYFDSKEFILYKYNEGEVILAFEAYKRAFMFLGEFENLKSEFKEKLKDPLMLRMLAEAYKDQKLPDFAPAVLVFERYEYMIKQEKGDVFIDFCYALAESKYLEAQTSENVSDLFEKKKIIHDPAFSYFRNIDIGIKRQDPIKSYFTLLEDEGIISAVDENHDFYRFTYDRFFEYLLGKVIGKLMQNWDLEVFVPNLLTLVNKVYSQHFSFLQALKSELVRINLKKELNQSSILKRTTLEQFLDEDNSIFQNFIREFIRELIFESEENVISKIQDIGLNEERTIQLILETAGDNPKAYPILVKGIMSGNITTIRRSLYFVSEQLDSSFFNNTKSTFGDLLWQRFTSSNEFAAEEIKGIVYLMASSFKTAVRERISWEELLKKIAVNVGLHLSPVGQEELKKQLFETINAELPLINLTHFQHEKMEYYWKVMTKQERVKALELVKLFSSPIKKLEGQELELIRFFGSEIKYWENSTHPENKENYNYVIEKRIAELILIEYSKNRFEHFCDILSTWVTTGYWLTIDLCLIVMQKALEFAHRNDKHKLQIGYKLIKEWSLHFKKELPKYFYLALNSSNPLEVNFVPFAQLATIECTFFTKPNQPVPSWITLLNSLNEDDHKIAILSMRGMWKQFPIHVLTTLEVVLSRTNQELVTLINYILKEMYLKNPNLLDDFFWKNKLSKERLVEIKSNIKINDPTGIAYNLDHLFYEFFVTSLEGRKIFTLTYEEMINSNSLKQFINNRVDSAFVNL